MAPDLSGFDDHLRSLLDEAQASSKLFGVDAKPLCLGLSGGSDSLALLVLLTRFAKRFGGRIHALCIDHGLQAKGAIWAAEAAAKARAMGASAEVLRWDGPYPKSGLSEAARKARHRLLAEAVRRAGASVLCLAHTHDDVRESHQMRLEGVPLGQFKLIAPSPVWPEGRDVVVLRPLLSARREGLRDLLRAEGFSWVEDPANQDPKYHRARTRLALMAAGEASVPSLSLPEASSVRPLPDLGPHAGLGLFALAREALLEGGIERLSLLVSSISGQEGRARGRDLVRLMAAVESGAPFRMTLNGAVIEGDQDQVQFLREAARIVPAMSTKGPFAFDGRFELSGLEPGTLVFSVKGQQSQLLPEDQRVLKALPASLRPTLLCAVHDGQVRLLLPVHAPEGISVRPLMAARFVRACGIWGSTEKLSQT